MNYLIVYSIIMTIMFIRMWINRDYIHKVIGDFTYMLDQKEIMDRKDQADWFYHNGHHGFTWKSPIWDRR